MRQGTGLGGSAYEVVRACGYHGAFLVPGTH